MWLPRRLTSVNPLAARMRHTSRPDRTRSLADRALDLGHIDFATQTAVDFVSGGGLEKQGEGLGKIVARLDHRLPLARDIYLRADSHIAITLAFDDCG